MTVDRSRLIEPYTTPPLSNPQPSSGTRWALIEISYPALQNGGLRPSQEFKRTMEQVQRKTSAQVDDRRKTPRTDMAETGIAVLQDGTRVVCIIHDMSETGSRANFGMRVELIDVPPGKALHSFDVHMKSGRVIRYTPGWKNPL